jgi:Ulp1 family protease
MQHPELKSQCDTETDVCDQSKPSILLFDSMFDSNKEMHNFSDNFNILRHYVEFEYIDKKVAPEHKRFFEDPAFKWEAFNQDTMPVYAPKTPEQVGYSDCGVHLLENAETFLHDPDFLLNNLQLRKPSAELYFLEDIKLKRDMLKRLIIVLAEGTHVDRKEGEKKGPNEEALMGQKYR